MTNEEAIKWLKDIHHRFNPTGEKLENEGGDVHLQALDMAIEALKVSEIPTGSDLISREEVLNMIIVAGECEPDLGYTHLHTVIESLPSADRTEPGWWEIKTETDEYGLKRPKLVCSKCKREPAAWDLTELFDFCPNCGAMMYKGGEDDGNQST